MIDEKCDMCDGFGYTKIEISDGCKIVDSLTRTCRRCGGQGRVEVRTPSRGPKRVHVETCEGD